MARVERIAVAGGTGTVGRRVAYQLVQAGYTVTILTRYAQRPSPVAGAQLVQADLRDPQALRAALEGQDGLFIALSTGQHELRNSFHAEEEGLVNLMRAAQQARIQRVGLVTPMLKDHRPLRLWWVMRLKRTAVKRIQLAGIPYAVFNTACIMETLAAHHRWGRFLLVPQGSRSQSWWISGDDLGRQVAAFFAMPQAPDRVLPVQGPEPWTFQEAARIWLAGSGARLRIVPVPISLLRVLGLLVPSAAHRAGWFMALRDYPEAFLAQSTWQLLGQPTTTLAQFAQSPTAIPAAAQP